MKLKEKDKAKVTVLIKRDRMQTKTNAMFKRDHLLGILESTHLTWARQKTDYLLNHEVIFKNCKTYGDTLRVLIAFDKEELMNQIESILSKAGVSWPQERISDLIYENVFADCKCHNDLVDIMEHLVITEAIHDLIVEIGLNWPKEYAKNLALDYKNVFHGCTKREEAIQRLLEIASIVTIA